MSDSRVVQCFGTLRRPQKEAKPCRRRFVWSSAGAKESHFGRRGAQACPHCGTMPDFRHPMNRMLSGEVDPEQAAALMPAYLEELAEKNKQP
ncbi:MAG: hypothetical protein DRQ89_14255 [Epsilonproteobacteria bacterium]|nr:MAG: hypothetical protein DRQ89_14255 [Campylobacterota bacterium]